MGNRGTGLAEPLTRTLSPRERVDNRSDARSWTVGGA